MTALDAICRLAIFCLLLVPIGEWIVNDFRRSRRNPLPMLDVYRRKDKQ